MDIREMRTRLGITQNEFSIRYHIPFRTIQNWESGLRTPPGYIVELLEKRVESDLVNRRTLLLPKHDSRKKNLPRRSDYLGATPWLKAVQKCLGDSIVFALDEALMCEGTFHGRSEEYIIWIYGDDSALTYNGVAILGNNISRYCIKEKDGLRYTDFNRTLADSFANESILDMQGITESLSKHYFESGCSFNGVFVEPKYQDRFEKLAEDAMDYYNN